MTTFRRLSVAVYLTRLFLLMLAVLSLSAEVRAQDTIKVGYYDMVVGAGVAAEQEAPIIAAGFTPVQLFTLTAADLAGIQVLFVQNPSNMVYGAEYLAGRPAIQTAVSAGLVLVIHDRAVGTATTRLILPVPAGSPMIMGTRQASGPTSINIDVSDLSTVVASGPGGTVTDVNLDGGNSSNQGWVNLAGGGPPGRKGLLHTGTSPTNQSVTFSYPFGAGFVIYSSIPLDFYLKGTGNNPPRCNFNNIYAPNVLAYAAGLKWPLAPAPQTTTLTVTSSTGQYGGTATLTATLKSGSTGLGCRTVNFSLNGTGVGSAQTDASGTATLTNASLGSIGAGIYLDGVRADFGVSGLLAASSGTAALEVTRAPLTVTADDKNTIYGTALPAFTASYDGFVLAEDVSMLGGTLTFATPATQTSPVGPYAITPYGLTSDNYAITFLDGTLTVTPAAALTITANNKGRLYGGSNPTFDGTIAGIQGEDNFTASYATEATSSSPVGTYDIVPTLLDPDGRLANYESVTVVNGVLTITRAASLTVTANDKDRQYGGTDPTFDGTIVGIQGEDNITATYVTDATSSSPVGTYDIVPALLDPNGRLANYEGVTVVNGVLTITRAASLTVTANDKDRQYYGTNPTFDGTIAGIQGEDNFTASYATEATLSSPVGTYDIVPTLVDPDGRLANYEPVTAVNGVLTITRAASLTVTANNKSRVYGGANPTFDGTIAGIQGEDNITASYATQATSSSSVGTYDIVPTLVDPDGKLANYEPATVVNGVLTITRSAALTVTANNKVRLYGGTNPTFDGTIVGIQGQDNITASYATQATSSSPVGTYDIVPTLVDPDGRLANYEPITVVNGALTINRAPLTVTANDRERLAGTANSVLTVRYAGFVNSDTPADFDAQPTVITTAVIGSPAGTYPIVVSGALDSNYAITHVNGTLTVSPTGRMHGGGFIDAGDARNHFNFDVREGLTIGERGTLTLRIDHNDLLDPDDLFVSQAVTSVIFSDNPAYAPGGNSSVDTVVFAGVGLWNGAGATFQAMVSDKGEPGSQDTFSITVLVAGDEVATFTGLLLGGGNVQSNRLPASQ